MATHVARLCVQVPVQQNLQPRSELTLYYEGGNQLGLLQFFLHWCSSLLETVITFSNQHEQTS